MLGCRSKMNNSSENNNSENIKDDIVIITLEKEDSNLLNVGYVQLADKKGEAFTIKQGESFSINEVLLNRTKLVQIDKEKGKCLMEYTGLQDRNDVNSKWMRINDEIFPMKYDGLSIIIKDINDNEIIVLIDIKE